MNHYYYRVEGARALQLISANDRATADLKASMLGSARFAYASAVDDFSDVQRPVPPRCASPIHDPWGLLGLD